MANDLGQQLALQQQINKTLKEQSGLLTQQARLLSQQAGYAKDMCNALDCGNLEDLTSQTQKLNDGLSEAADRADTAADSMSGLDKAAQDADKSFRNKAIGVGAAAGAFRGFMGAIKLGAGLLGGLLQIVGRLAGSFMSLTQSILAAPFKMLTALIQMSKKGGIDPLREALEEVREQFGSLATNEGASLKGSVKEMRKEMHNMAGTGLAMSRVFEFGRKGLAEFVKENQELAEALGTAFSSMAESLKGNYLALSMYRKGLGLTNEQQALSLKLARDRGKDLAAEQDAFASMAIQMGKSFNINAKVVAKSMAKMQEDVSSFGHMSAKQFASAAIYAHKLGVEIEDLGAMFDKFDNFENAAKGAAELAQMFGMNIDPIKMLKAEDPAAMMDDLRKAFFATGRSLQDLNRHERKLLEQQTGLKDAALEAAFGLGNQGLAYSDIQAASEDAEKSQLTQAEAMKELADSIKKMTRDGSHDFESFFDAFTKGFTKGIERSREFRKIMRNLQRSLWTVYRAGIRVGRAFVRFFPGIKEVAKGLGDLFNPARFRRLAKRVTGIFKTFFKDMHQSPQKAVKKLFDSLLSMFEGHFGSSGVHLKRIVQGFRKFFVALGGMVSGLIPIIKEKIAEGLEGIIDLIVNPPGAVLGKAAKAGQSFVLDVFGPIWEALTGNPELNKRIFDGLKKLGNMIMKKLKAVDWSPVTTVLEGIMIKMMLFSVMSTLGGSLVGAIAGGLGGFFKDVLTRGAAQGAAAAAPAVAGSLASGMSPARQGAEAAFAGLTGRGPTAAVAGTIPTSAALQAAEAAAPNPAQSASAGLKVGQMLIVVGAMIVALAAVVLIYKKANLKPMDAVGIAALLVAVAGAAALMSPALVALDAAPPLSKSIIPKLAVLGLVIGGLGYMGVALAKALADMKNPPSLAAIGAWGTMMLGMVGVSIPLLIAANIIGSLAEAGGAAAIKGLVVLGAVMAGLGVVGLLIAGMLSLIPNPVGVGILMDALVSIMYATMIMVPVAAALGTVLLASVGTAGVAIAAGFAALGTLATGLIIGLLPAVASLSVASRQIGAPKKFQAVADLFIKMMDTAGKFMASAAKIAEGLKPPGLSAQKIEKNIGAFGELMDNMLKVGIHQVMDKVILLAKSEGISEQGLKAVSGVTSVLGNVAALMNALSPTSGEMAAVKAAIEGEIISGTRPEEMMQMINNRLKMVLKGLPGVLGSLGTQMSVLITKIQPAIEAVSKKDVKPKALKALGAILTSTFGAMGTLISATASIADSMFKRGEDPSKNMLFFKDMVKNMVSSFSDMGPGIRKLVTSVLEIAQDPVLGQKGLLKKVKVLSGVLEATGEIAQLFSAKGPLGYVEGEFEEALGLTKIDQMADIMGQFRTKLLQPGGPLQLMINDLGGLKLPKKGATRRLKILTRIMGLSNDLGASVAEISQKDIKAATISANMGSIKSAVGILDSMLEVDHLKNPKKALAVAKSIQTLNGLLDGSVLAQTVEDVKPFAGGDLRVTHNLPKTSINLTVKIDTEEFAKKMIKVDLDRGADGRTSLRAFNDQGIEKRVQ